MPRSQVLKNALAACRVASRAAIAASSRAISPATDLDALGEFGRGQIVDVLPSTCVGRLRAGRPKRGSSSNSRHRALPVSAARRGDEAAAEHARVGPSTVVDARKPVRAKRRIPVRNATAPSANSIAGVGGRVERTRAADLQPLAGNASSRPGPIQLKSRSRTSGVASASRGPTITRAAAASSATT